MQPPADAATPTQACSGWGCSFWAAGVGLELTLQFWNHWPSCPGVESLSFHPDGSLSSVTFKR